MVQKYFHLIGFVPVQDLSLFQRFNRIRIHYITFSLLKFNYIEIALIMQMPMQRHLLTFSCFFSFKACTANKQSSQERFAEFSTLLVRQTQERIIEDVYLYLLGSEDKLRLETARSLARFVANMSFYDVCSTPNQNSLLALGEHLLKSGGGFSSNLFNSSIIDNDAFNLNSISFLFNKNSSSLGSTASTSSAATSATTTPTNLLHGSRQRQIRYSCSPLSAVSLLSSLPWLSKSNNVLNNNFIQPFHSLIKYWPSSASYSNSIQNNLNKVVEHNLNYLIPVLVKTLVNSVDKYQFIGCLETLDFIFQTYTPAIYYASTVASSVANHSTSDANYQQLYDLLHLFISYLRHPLVSFDLYVHDILMRLIGSLFCSYAWLSMKKMDKLMQQLNFNLTNQTNSNVNISTFFLCLLQW